MPVALRYKNPDCIWGQRVPQHGERRVITTRIGFIGLGNVGASLAGNLLRSGVDLTVRDLNEETVASFVAQGAKRGESPRAIAEAVDIVITCLPSPAVSAAVVEGPDGIIHGLSPGKAWLEMSTTDSGAAAIGPPPATSRSSQAVRARPSSAPCRCCRSSGTRSCTRVRSARRRCSRC
jgi:3-hydroxyisobutyrate dehydrogenase